MYKIILGFKCCPNSLHMKKRRRSLLKTMAAPHVWMHWKCMKCRHNCTSSCWCCCNACHAMLQWWCWWYPEHPEQEIKIGWLGKGKRLANNVLNSKRSLKLEFSTFCLFPWLVKWQHHCGVTTAVAAPAFLLLINAVVLIATHSFTPSVLHLRVAYWLVWLYVCPSNLSVLLSMSVATLDDCQT